ncbi:helix-turn-helix domain-containing protein [Streptomyces telluris]|uniref:Helix-turn-helix domain-containing protein n=1 Tax=Streptomyces telluris TaxID=2720021 RepID=A0A9X2LLM1_9ACTN|nr:helix-turn-helix transcriptional regulator [Streptomyces telluris]MCQ8773453.1 helix-turn-helix domain-containing protein [Streptomyces telluris]
MEAGDLAEMLRSLKERSGLSYGVLAKRLHVSTSTLHRYCSGSAVPTEFAPVERLARLCKATPEELMEVHRRWIVADATRGRKTQAAAAVPEAAAAAAPEPESAPDSEAAVPAAAAVAAEPIPGAAPERADERPPAAAPAGSVSSASVAPSVAASGKSVVPQRWRPSRKAVLAALSAVAAATVLGSTALAVGLGGDDGPGAAAERPAGAASPAVAGAHGKPGSSGGPSAGPGGSPSASASGNEKNEKKEGGEGGDGEKESGAPAASPSQGGSAPAAPGGKPHDGTAEKGVPLTAHVRPYAFEDPCTQRYLVDRPPGDVTPPPTEQDAPGWVSTLGGVAAGGQYIEITLQGVGKDTVVLEGLHVRVQGTKAPLPWNSYIMGVGCGGDVSTKSFGVDLDAARPAVTPKDGQRDFPYKVSERDPEVFYVKAAAAQHDVKWYLELQWSSGDRRGVLRLDDQGRPFRTSGAGGRPVYQQPPGSSQGWVPAPDA